MRKRRGDRTRALFGGPPFFAVSSVALFGFVRFSVRGGFGLAGLPFASGRFVRVARGLRVTFRCVGSTACRRAFRGVQAGVPLLTFATFMLGGRTALSFLFVWMVALSSFGAKGLFFSFFSFLCVIFFALLSSAFSLLLLLSLGPLQGEGHIGALFR